MNITASTRVSYKIAYNYKDNIQRGMALLSTASFLVLFVLNVLSLSKLYSPHSLGFINLGLSLGSFGCAFGAGISKIGLTKEVLHTLPIIIISILATWGLGTVGSGSAALKNMSIGIIASQGIAGLYYLLGNRIHAYLHRSEKKNETPSPLTISEVRPDDGLTAGVFNPLSH